MNKADVALIQLERAMRLFLEENDYISAITLSGAAEEILGKQVNDRPNALDELVEIISMLLRKRGINIEVKNIQEHLNYPRNSLKHLKVGNRNDLNYPALEAASELIERAISNYIRVTSFYPDEELYRSFISKISSNSNTKES
jgi:hypothetical protein